MENIIFCANCQAETGQTLLQNKGGSQDLVSTCSVCGRQLKWPMNITQDELTQLFQAQLEENDTTSRLIENKQRDEDLVNEFKLSQPHLDTQVMPIWGEEMIDTPPTNTSAVDFAAPEQYNDVNSPQLDTPAEG